MNRYRVGLDLICPSNWIDGDVRKYIERITPTREERESIKITSLDPPALSTVDYPKACKNAMCQVVGFHVAGCPALEPKP